MRLPVFHRVPRSIELHSSGAGVRSRGIDELVISLNEWTDETANAKNGDGAEGSGSAPASAPMVFPSDEPYAPPSPWQYAVYKVIKKTGTGQLGNRPTIDSLTANHQ